MSLSLFPSRLQPGVADSFSLNPKELPMFIPFLTAISAATAFAQLGAMSVKIAMLTASLQAMVMIAIALAAYALWIKAT